MRTEIYRTAEEWRAIQDHIDLERADGPDLYFAIDDALAGAEPGETIEIKANEQTFEAAEAEARAAGALV